MLNAPPPSSDPNAMNMQSTQLLSSPNSRALQSLQGWARMGMKSPGGLATPASAPNWPVGGFASGMPGLSQSPLQQPTQAQMVAALRGQTHG